MSTIPSDSTARPEIPRAGSDAAPSASRPPALRWPARLDSLRIKLFVAIAGANAILALAAYLVFSWSFDQGFVEYLNRADEARLQPLIVRLADGYEKEGNWDWLAKDRRRWFDLMREMFGTSRPARRSDDVAPAAPPAPSAKTPAPDPLLTIDPRLLLFDAQRQLLVGREEMAREAVLKPIPRAGSAEVVGHLGYVPRLKVVESLEKLFSAQQERKFAAIAVGMLLAGLLIGAVLAHWLTRRTRRLAEGAAELIQGNYSVRIPARGHDELSRLTQDFNQLAQTLEAARRARQQWIADIAHELRTPLAVLRAEIEALQDGVRPLGVDSMNSLAQEVSQLARLVEDLRLLSLSDMGSLNYHKEPLDLGEVIEDSFASQQGALDSSGLQVRLDLEPDVLVMADGSRLAQVFANLLQNTLRYTDAPGHVAVDLFRSGDHAKLVWEDSSPGVSQADLPRLTERLFRVEVSRSRSGGGSGLGLAIVKAIVEGHGGTIAAAQSPLCGLRWELTFPLFESGIPHG